MERLHEAGKKEEALKHLRCLEHYMQRVSSGSLPRAGVILASLFFGGREAIGMEEVELMRDLCRTIGGADER